MYLVLKLIHVFGVILFLGNITVGVFWKSYADRTKNATVIASTIDGIIAADRVFTIPGLLLLLLAGIGTAVVGGIPILGTGWILWSLIAFALSGAAFGPLSRVQRRLSAAAHRSNLDEYEELSGQWNLWGTIALILPFIAFAFMILKPALPAFHPPSAQAATQGLGLHLAPCAIGREKAPARCGTFGVYENRKARAGRVIQLNVVVVSARRPSHKAIAEIAGGPGQAVVEFAEPVVDGGAGQARMKLRNDYDFIFMDDRGMGKSNPFHCDFAPRNDPAAYFLELFPRHQVAACREESLATHNSAQYNTDTAVDDLDDLRDALGYDRIVLDGGSYGTYFALIYMRKHPAHVESAVLDSVSAPGFQPLPGEPMGAQKALDDLFARCRDGSVCSARYPKFAAHFSAVLHRMDAGPISVPARNAVTRRMQTVALSKEVFVDNVRHVLYYPEASAYLPYAIERAYHNDYGPVGLMIQTVIVQFATALNDGAFLSYTCADWVPFLDPNAVAQARLHSFTGDLRIRAQQTACVTWNVPALSASFNDPVRSDAPVLMILGSDDPGTPPGYALQALRYLPNGKAAIVKGAGHDADTPCTDDLVYRFVRARSAAQLDTNKCAATQQYPPFATSMHGWP